MKYNGKDIELTKEEAIRLHKEMWNYVTNEESKMGYTYPLKSIEARANRLLLKHKWILDNGYSEVLHDSFLCEYDDKEEYGPACLQCLGNWVRCTNDDLNKNWKCADPSWVRDICD